MLCKGDITELKSLSRPPALVKKVMECVCILLGAPATWASAKKLLGDKQFTSRLLNYSKASIDKKILKQAKKYYDDPEFTPAAVAPKSKAAVSLCVWCRSMMQGDTGLIAPKKVDVTKIEPAQVDPTEPVPTEQPCTLEARQPNRTAAVLTLRSTITGSSIDGGIFGEGPIAAPTRTSVRKHLHVSSSVEGGIFGGGAYEPDARRAAALQSAAIWPKPLALPPRPSSARGAVERQNLKNESSLAGGIFGSSPSPARGAAGRQNAKNESSLAGGIFGAGRADASPAPPATARVNPNRSSVSGGIFGLGPVAGAMMPPPSTRFNGARNASGIPGGIFAPA